MFRVSGAWGIRAAVLQSFSHRTHYVVLTKSLVSEESGNA